jgi:integrase
MLTHEPSVVASAATKFWGTRATLALGSGVHPRIVQERLGHSTIAVTLDTYSHVTAGMQEDAAEQVASLFL